ncbi:MAG TPA: AAA family ATPase [Thermoguttaceae bacterium]|nr:AAA family ATPase [Thermoguttaceae bacterium]
MRSIAVMNQKGGVGKTTTAVNLGAALAEAGQRVCLVDLDPQAHASLHVGIEPRGDRPSVYDVLVGDCPLREVRQEVSAGFWVIPSDLDLAAAEVELAGVVGREMILRDKLQEDDHPLDYLLVDCPPSLGVLTLNALTAVREVLIPLQPHFLALHGLGKLLETIELVAKRLNPLLRVTGVVFCMYDAATRLAQEVIQDVEDFFASRPKKPSPWSEVRIFQTRIRRNIRLAEAPSFGQSIFRYAPQSPGADDYRALADELLRSAPVQSPTLS